jgi:hypothetical protein
MSNLATVLDIINSEFTVDSSVQPPNQSNLIKLVNATWEELYFAVDLPDSRYTMSIAPNFTNPQLRTFTLPWYVQEVRAIREGRSGLHVKLLQPEHYYHPNEWFQKLWEFVNLGHSPMVNVINNATRITFTLKKPETTPFSIYVQGSTDVAGSVTETINVPAGSLSVSTINSFTNITGCSKTIFTQSDIAGVDGDGTQIIEIASCCLSARNLKIQMRDKADFSTTACLCYEILFKWRAPYLLYPGDAIAEPYDKVLAYLVLSKMYAKVLAKEIGTVDPRSAYFKGLAKEILDMCSANEEVGTERSFNMEKDGLMVSYRGKI